MAPWRQTSNNHSDKMLLVFFTLVIIAAAAPPGVQEHALEPWGEDQKCPDCGFVEKFWRENTSFGPPTKETMENFIKYIDIRYSNGRAEVKDGKFILTLPLKDFTENEIRIKAKDGYMALKAISSTKVSGKYVSFPLPENVDPAGKWTFYNEVLELVFPLKN